METKWGWAVGGKPWSTVSQEAVLLVRAAGRRARFTGADNQRLEQHMFLKFNSWGPLDEYTGRGLNHVQHDQVVEVADDLGAALLKDFPNNWRASTAEAYATWLKTKPAPTQTTGRCPPASPSGAKKLETPEPVGGPKPGAVTPVGTSGTQLPAPPLKSDGPTLEEYVKAGYEPKTYPPHGYAPKAFKQKRMDDLQITFE